MNENTNLPPSTPSSKEKQETKKESETLIAQGEKDKRSSQKSPSALPITNTPSPSPTFALTPTPTPTQPSTPSPIPTFTPTITPNPTLAAFPVDCFNTEKWGYIGYGSTPPPSTTKLGCDFRAVEYYLIAICTQAHNPYIKEIDNGEMPTSSMGEIAGEFWYAISDHFPHVTLNEFKVMPNHIVDFS